MKTLAQVKSAAFIVALSVSLSSCFAGSSSNGNGLFQTQGIVPSKTYVTKKVSLSDIQAISEKGISFGYPGYQFLFFGRCGLLSDGYLISIRRDLCTGQSDRTYPCGRIAWNIECRYATRYFHQREMYLRGTCLCAGSRFF